MRNVIVAALMMFSTSALAATENSIGNDLVDEWTEADHRATYQVLSEIGYPLVRAMITQECSSVSADLLKNNLNHYQSVLPFGGRLPGKSHPVVQRLVQEQISCVEMESTADMMAWMIQSDLNYIRVQKIRSGLK